MVTTRINTTAFDRALRQYVTLSKSEAQDIINKKAFYIARGACRETKRADPKEIKALAERSVIGTGVRYRKGVGKKFTLKTSLFSTPAARILVGRAIRQGKPFPKKNELRKQIKAFIAARLRSRAYLASGWLPAIKTLAAIVRKKGSPPSMGASVKVYGKPKGRAIPAKAAAWSNIRAIIENSTGVPGKFGRTQPQALEKFGRPALEKAVAAETASTLAEIARRFKAAAIASGIKAV